MMQTVQRCFLPALDPQLSTVQISDHLAQDFSHTVLNEASIMVEPNENDKSLNLESFASDELERKSVCETESDEILTVYDCISQGPQTSRQCKSSERELLLNNFDAVE